MSFCPNGSHEWVSVNSGMDPLYSWHPLVLAGGVPHKNGKQYSIAVLSKWPRLPNSQMRSNLAELVIDVRHAPARRIFA